MIDNKTKEVFCRNGSEFISYCGHVEDVDCPKLCNYSFRYELYKLKDHFEGGDWTNIMKKVAVDWELIREEYLDYKIRLNLTAEESRILAFIDMGYLTLEDLR